MLHYDTLLKELHNESYFDRYDYPTTQAGNFDLLIGINRRGGRGCGDQ